ncbi:MAG: GNAT family N-acetyltransferase [Proteobacteria bacterium]|nr:GNAT family N-acetyltransferase [Pseudomonadota bacterium]
MKWLPCEEASFYWPGSYLESSLRPESTWVLAEEGFILSMVTFQDLLSDGEVLILATHPSARGKGFARKLLQALTDAKQYKRLWLEVHEKNEGALRFYQSLGFLQVGQRPTYYRDGGTALLLELKR